MATRVEARAGGLAARDGTTRFHVRASERRPDAVGSGEAGRTPATGAAVRAGSAPVTRAAARVQARAGWLIPRLSNRGYWLRSSSLTGWGIGKQERIYQLGLLGFCIFYARDGLQALAAILPFPLRQFSDSRLKKTVILKSEVDSLIS